MSRVLDPWRVPQHSLRETLPVLEALQEEARPTPGYTLARMLGHGPLQHSTPGRHS